MDDMLAVGTSSTDEHLSGVRVDTFVVTVELRHHPELLCESVE